MGDKRNGMAVESIRQDFQYAFTPVGYRKMQYFTLRKDLIPCSAASSASRELKLPLKESIATTILFMFVTD